MVEKAIYSRLIANAAVLALVVKRVYPELAPQDTTLPYIVYTRIDTDHNQTKSNTEGLARAQVQLNCVADTYDGAKDLANKVRIALGAATGSIGGITVHSTIVLGEVDSSEFPGDDTDKVRHRIVSDFAFWFSETVPS